MTKIKRAWLALAPVLLAMATTTLADTAARADGNWYFAPLTGVVIDNDDRNSGAGYGVHLGLGRQLADQWNLEFGLAGDRLDDVDRHERFGVSIDLMRLLRYRGVAPYLIVGAGYLKTRVHEGLGDDNLAPPDRDRDNVVAAIGGGFFTPLLDNGGQFRADARYRIDRDSDIDRSDVLLQIGLQFPLRRDVARLAASDSDLDGVRDGLDVCPGTPMQFSVDKYGCEHDGDGDGVADRLDACPETAHSVAVNAGGCRL